MWKFAIVSSAGLVAFALSVNAANARASFCPRHTVQFQDLAHELTLQASNCNQPIVCMARVGQSYQIGQVETKKIASYGQIQQWITQTNSLTTPYTVTQQNAMITTARNLAAANRPAGKFVSGIKFFSDFTVGQIQRAIGADVYYAKCLY